MSRPCHVVRVFTRGDTGGNHLGIVNDVVGVSDTRKQAIASELGFSETIFVDWTDPSLDPAVRIFTPTTELPFAGHPLVGAAWVLGTLGPVQVQRLRTGVGSVSCRVEGDTAFVTTAIEPTIHADDVASAAAAAGLPLPIRTTRIGLPKHYLIAEYGSFDDISTLDPDMEALMGFLGLTVFARDGDQVKMRFFAPGAGVPEDPATGSAAVALAHAFAGWGEHLGEVTISQGDEIGHPSTIRLSWTPDGATIAGSVRRDEIVMVT